LIAAIKDWLPITKRNRVALGFAGFALVLFVTWNFMPYYKPYLGSIDMNSAYERDGYTFMHIWPQFFDPDKYIKMIKSPDLYDFMGLAVKMCVLTNSLLILMIIPFWKVIHVSKFLRIPLALLNSAGGCFFYIAYTEIQNNRPYMAMAILLISISLFSLSVSLFIFKNELELRHELEVKRMMGGGDSQ
jgi:hypothetical protein